MIIEIDQRRYVYQCTLQTIRHELLSLCLKKGEKKFPTRVTPQKKPDKYTTNINNPRKKGNLKFGSIINAILDNKRGGILSGYLVSPVFIVFTTSSSYSFQNNVLGYLYKCTTYVSFYTLRLCTWCKLKIQNYAVMTAPTTHGPFFFTRSPRLV